MHACCAAMLNFEISPCCLPRAGQWLAPNVRSLNLSLSSSLHWSCLAACNHLEQVSISLQRSSFEDDSEDLKLCELSLQGCDPDCLQTIETLNLEVDSLKEDGQFSGALCHQLRNMSLFIRQPQLSAFNILGFFSRHWVASAVNFEEGFSCSFMR